MKQAFLFLALAALLGSCQQGKNTTITSLCKGKNIHGCSQETATTMAFLVLDQVIEVLPDSVSYRTYVDKMLWAEPCVLANSPASSRPTSLDVQDAAASLLLSCTELQGDWFAGYVWVLTTSAGRKSWTLCPSLLKDSHPKGKSIYIQKKVVMTNPSHYGEVILVQCDKPTGNDTLPDEF